jgi:SAM-dependent methyltransferase
MHQVSFDKMRELLSFYAPSKGKLLDVGSQNINGCYRSLVSNAFDYTGLDVSPGNNVDVVSPDLYNWPIPSNNFDVVISGQCLEHVEDIWLWVKEIYRVCKPCGYAFIIAPWSCGEHRHPKDCWRIFPDGMKYLLTSVAGFRVIECGRNEKDRNDIGDTWGVGVK